MDLEKYVKERTKVPLKVLLSLFTKEEILTSENLEIIGKNKNIVKYVNNPLNICNKIENKKFVTTSIVQYNTFPKFIEKLSQILQSFGFKKIESAVITTEFFNYELLNISLQHPDRNQINSFLSNKFLICNDTERIYNIIESNKLPIEKTSLVNKNDIIYSPISLRTHTTASMFEYLYKNGISTRDFYIIGDIFRREREDSMHLIQFTQLEIFSHTCKTYENFLTIINSILLELGFEKCKFTPTKYPYTEPSFQVDVLHKEKWIELGGGGIFLQNISKNFTNEVCYGFGFGCERLFLLLKNLKKLSEINEI